MHAQAELGGVGLDVGEHGGVRGLGHQEHGLGGRVVGQGTEGLAGGAPPDGGLEVAAADAEAVAQADPGGVEQAHHLLRAGAGRRDDADRPGAHDVGEAEGDTGDVRGAAVGPHDEHVGGGRGVLEPHLVVDGDVVGEQHHAQPRRDGVEGLGDGVLARHRDDREVGAGAGGGRAEGARGDLVVTAAARVAGAPQRGEGLGDRRQPGIQPGGVVGTDRDDEVVGAGLGGHVEAHAAAAPRR